MPPESLSSSPKHTQTLILTVEQADFAMGKFGISREALDVLTKNPEFSPDLEHIKDNPYNQTELTQFNEKYPLTVDKKDGGQIFDTRFGKMTGKEIMESSEKDTILNTMDDATYSKYEFFLKNRANEAIKTGQKLDATNGQKIATGQKLDATNGQKIATGQKLDATIGSGNQDLQKLDATISEKESSCAEEAKNLYKTLSPNGASELKNRITSLRSSPDTPEYKELLSTGATAEQIQSGKLDGVLTGLYVYNHRQEFITNGWIAEGKEQDFKKTLDNFSDILGKDRQIPAVRDFVQNTLISGERKEMTLKGVDTIAGSGKYDLSKTTYNAETGMITFRSIREGESAHIDTSRTPPILAYSKSGLSIERPLEKQKPSPIEEERVRGIQDANKNFSENKNTTRTALLQNGYQVLIDPSEDGKKFIEKYQNFSFSDALNPQKRAEIFTAINTEKIRVKGLPGDTSNTELDKKQKAAQSSIEKSLDSFKETIDITVKNIDTLPKIPKDSNTTFESTAQYNLNFLSKIGYDGIGQSNMERIIRTLNSSQNPSLSSVGEIDLNQKLDTPKTQALTLAIANLVRNGRTSTGEQSAEQKKTEESQRSWDNVDKLDLTIAARQTQSLGFRESLRSVAHNMSQEGGSLKTDSAMKKVLFGIDPRPEGTSSLNTKSPESSTRFA